MNIIKCKNPCHGLMTHGVVCTHSWRDTLIRAVTYINSCRNYTLKLMS